MYAFTRRTIIAAVTFLNAARFKIDWTSCEHCLRRCALHMVGHFGKTLGVAAGTAVAVGGTLLIPPVKRVAEIVDYVTRWFSPVTLPF